MKLSRKIKDKGIRAILNRAVSLFAALSLLLCTGCAKADVKELFNPDKVQKVADELSARPDTIQVFDTDGTEITASESVINMMEDDGSEDFVSAADMVAKGIDPIGDGSSDYAYSKLNSDEQQCYKEILAVLMAVEEDVLLSTVNNTMVDHTFRCVLADHPEIFYVKGYSISKYLMGDEIKKITFTGSYTMTKEEAESKKDKIDSYVNRCLSEIPENSSEYEKVKYVYEYLIDHNTYELESENNQNILSVVENGVTVCQGYAKMTQLLLNKMGIFCTLVNGAALNATPASQEDGDVLYSSGSESIIDDEEHDDLDGWGAHVWNIAKVDGNYYNIDTTWGDSSFLYTDAQSEEYIDGPDINYDFLMVPDEMIASTHIAKPVVDMPPCNSMQDCYYVREGLYFTEIDKDQLKSAFGSAYERGELFISLKCADEACFDEMQKYLFEKEKVFDYLSGNSVRYVVYPERLVVSIYL